MSQSLGLAPPYAGLLVVGCFMSNPILFMAIALPAALLVGALYLIAAAFSFVAAGLLLTLSILGSY